YRSMLGFGQPCEAGLRFLDSWGIANIHSLCDDACRMPDSASFRSGPGQGINWTVCLEEVSMGVSRQHRVDDGKIRSRVAKMDISPVNYGSKFVRVVGNQDLTVMQVAVDKRVA